MRQKEDLNIVSLLNTVLDEQYIEDRENLCAETKESILKVQQEN